MSIILQRPVGRMEEIKSIFYKILGKKKNTGRKHLTFKPIICPSRITVAYDQDQAFIQSNIKLNIYLDFSI